MLIITKSSYVATLNATIQEKQNRVFGVLFALPRLSMAQCKAVLLEHVQILPNSYLSLVKEWRN